MNRAHPVTRTTLVRGGTAGARFIGQARPGAARIGLRIEMPRSSATLPTGTDGNVGVQPGARPRATPCLTATFITVLMLGIRAIGKRDPAARRTRGRRRHPGGPPAQEPSVPIRRVGNQAIAPPMRATGATIRRTTGGQQPGSPPLAQLSSGQDGMVLQASEHPAQHEVWSGDLYIRFSTYVQFGRRSIIRDHGPRLVRPAGSRPCAGHR